MIRNVCTRCGEPAQITRDGRTLCCSKDNTHVTKIERKYGERRDNSKRETWYNRDRRERIRRQEIAARELQRLAEEEMREVDA